MAASCVGPEQEGEGLVRAGEKMNSAWVQHERVVNTTLRVGSHWARGKGGLG